MKAAHNVKGFTLIELLLSVLTISVIAGISIPVYISYQSRTELEQKVSELSSALRRAQSYARSSNGDSQWGVNIQSGVSATLYKGASYATRDVAEDEIVYFPPTITTSGLSDILFAKLTAAPSTSGTITVTSTPISQNKVITLNAAGMVNY